MPYKQQPQTLLSRKQAARHLGVSPNTLAAWASNKRYNLNFTKVGSLAKYTLTDLNKFLEDRLVRNT